MLATRINGHPNEVIVEPDANYAVGTNPACITKIQINHIGFPPNAGKFCVIVNPPEREFIVWRHVLIEEKDRVFKDEFHGVLREGGTEISLGLVGDFSGVEVEGLYYISCGKCRSRQFVIRKKVYDVPLRTLLNYFQLQRCGNSPLGWAGPCHLDDGVIAGGKGKRDFSGGHHQSCDLRKWPCLLNLAYIGLVQFGLRYSGHWDVGQVADEIRWGCDYYHKLLREDGGLFDSVFIPLGWDPREFYDSDAPAPALWNTIRHQALASIYFRHRDPSYSRKCLDVAIAVWQHMTRSNRECSLYQAPALPPRGHNHWNDFFSVFYPGSAIDMGHRLCSAASLFRATGEQVFLNDISTCATALTKFQLPANRDVLGAACFRNGNNQSVYAEASICFWQSSGPQGLCDALELLPQHSDAGIWKDSILRIVKQSKQIAESNPYGRVPGGWNGSSARLPSYSYYSYGYNMDIIAQAIFLRRAAVLLNEADCLKIAQRQLDHVLGANLLDASSVEGVGYNQSEHVKTGEFLPPTPQIPGAVNTGIGSVGVEYDAPPTGWLMWLLAEASDLKSFSKA